MTLDPSSLRNRISHVVSDALAPLTEVLAGWEGGSAAFGAVDDYSDVDLNFLVEDGTPIDLLYSLAEQALQTISPITASHPAPPGRYYKLMNSGEFLLIDLAFIRTGAADHSLDVERHGIARPLFDKGEWLRPRPFDEAAVAAKRDTRYQELQTWFPISQCFVRKAILRKQQTEALACFWGYTLKPLVDLLRMRHCPARWDFGMRYLDRDLPPAVCGELRELVFVRDVDDLNAKLTRAEAWGLILLKEVEPTKR